MNDLAARQRAWLAVAARAPSPHNAQPARWRFDGEVVELWQDASRWLAAADPGARDHRIALGMAWEALDLAAGADNWRLEAPVFDVPATAAPPLGNPTRVAWARLAPDTTADPLAAWQLERHCWRGRFADSDAATRALLADSVTRHAQVAWLLPEAAAEPVSRWHDHAAAELLRDPAVAGELRHWMRHSPRSRDWPRDGLAADCLLLSRWEAHAAALLMRPLPLRWLARLGMLRLVVSERAPIRSAAGLVLIHAAMADDPFAIGRAWYRFWLALTANGLAAVPMSSSVDEPFTRARLLQAFPLPAGRTPVNLMRVGRRPATVPASARLPVEELLMRMR